MKIIPAVTASAVATAVGAVFAGQAFAADAQALPSASEAMAELAKQGVMVGSGDGNLQPERNVTRAELAKIAALGFKLDAGDAAPKAISDVAPNAWHAPYVSLVGALGVIDGTTPSTFAPSGAVSQAQLALVVSRAAKVGMGTVTAAIPGYSPLALATRAQVARTVVAAQRALADAPVQITNVKALNAMTVELVLSKPIAEEEAKLELAQRNLTFDNGLRIVNVPRLKSGSASTYIVPVTVQKSGTVYAFQYKGKPAGTFVGSGEKIALSSARSVTNDTFEVESFRADGVTDYGYVIQAYAKGRGDLAFALDADNRYGGQAFQVISSLRERVVTITPEGGQPIVAAYVPFTQSTDGRQAPKFRMPEGVKLNPGTTYTVTSEWFTLANPTFKAEAAEPLTLQSAKITDDATIEVALNADPGDELFAGRSVSLKAEDGTTITATYKFQSRKGAVGVFELQNGSKLTPGAKYEVD